MEDPLPLDTRRNIALGYRKGETIPDWGKNIVWASCDEDKEKAIAHPLGMGDIRRACRRVRTLCAAGGREDVVNGGLRRYEEKGAYTHAELDKIIIKAERISNRLQKHLSINNPPLGRAYADLHLIMDTAHKLVLGI